MSDPKSRSKAIWGIVILFTVAGGIAGFAGGQLATREKVIAEVAQIRAAFSEADKARAAALNMCLSLAPQAAKSAADAAKEASDAAQDAAKAAGKASEEK